MPFPTVFSGLLLPRFFFFLHTGPHKNISPLSQIHSTFVPPFNFILPLGSVVAFFPKLSFRLSSSHFHVQPGIHSLVVFTSSFSSIKGAADPRSLS